MNTIRAPQPTEARISINGVELTEAQSCMVRVAVASYLHDLADPTYCAEIGPVADGHRARLVEVQDLIFTAFRN